MQQPHYQDIPFDWSFYTWTPITDLTLIVPGTKVYDPRGRVAGTVNDKTNKMVEVYWQPQDNAGQMSKSTFSVNLLLTMLWVDPALNEE